MRKRLTFQMLVYLFFSAFVDCSMNLGDETKLVACCVCVCVSGRVLHGAACVSPREAQRVAVLVFLGVLIVLELLQGFPPA